KLHASNNSLFKINNQLNPITADLENTLRQYYVASFFLKGESFNNLLNPTESWSLSCSLDLGSSSADFVRWKGEAARTLPLPYPGQAIAGRLSLSQLSGKAIPLYEYATLGGRDNLRGYPWYRFRGLGSSMVNLEYRFPIFWAIGGVLLFDSGRVYDRAGMFALNSWATDYGFGVRLYLPTMTLRADYSIGNEGGFVTFYYNHAF
ncbi:MAG: BamA/TamA family outer membrane protein, partial [Candidatus Margulisbacteria bacterium]|nr:BamA/TamA family outer membrane protein [Candidatus Margulisiibacteriota bacterium]